MRRSVSAGGGDGCGGQMASSMLPPLPPSARTAKTVKAANQLKGTLSPNYTSGPGFKRLSLLQSSNLIFCSTSLIN